MPLSDKEDTWIQGFFEAAGSSGQLSDWERDFIDDQEKRYKEYGADMRMSPKQWQVLFRAAQEKLLYPLPDGVVVEERRR